MRRYVGKPEQPESGGACFRETNEPIDPPCGELACALRIFETRRHGLKAKARLARIHNVRRAGPIEPVRRRAGHCAVGGDPVENDVEQQRQPRLIADRREFPDCRVRVTIWFQRRIGALEIVRQKDVAI